MLKHLLINNIVLVESAEIAFKSGLNVISGETGSGKSAIMNSLALIAGEKTDSNMLRHGAEKGSVEAAFDIDMIPLIHYLLEERGINHDLKEELIIRREISANSKNRAFVNNQLVQLGLLREIGALLVEIVGQHANQRLLFVEKHRYILDLFGGLESQTKEFLKSWKEEQELFNKVEQLVSSEAQRLRAIETCQMELNELREANLKEHEEERIFTEYTLLANSEELTGKVNEIINTLTGERYAALAHLNRQKSAFEQLVRIDGSFTEIAQSFSSALIELSEVAHSLNKYLSRIESNPSRLAELNDRLSLISKLKRKYGSSVEEILGYHKNAAEHLKQLQNADYEIEEMQCRLKTIKQHNDFLCSKLTKGRQEAAQKLGKAVCKELKSLNMPKAAFHCIVKPQVRNQHGDDSVEFYLSPNVGEKQMPLKECASGGELSRVMLALQTILAGKEKTPTLIFDEIDANIGGETASVVGEQLRTIAGNHQVLCITHFPQVAAQAHHHVQISKHEKNGRTFTFVTSLDNASRRQELNRMLGQKK